MKKLPIIYFYTIDSFFLLLHLKFYRHFKQIPVKIQVKRTSLQLHKVFRDRQSQTASFSISGNIPADKTLCQFVCRNIQRLRGNILEGELYIRTIHTYIYINSRVSMAYLAVFPKTFSRTLQSLRPSAQMIASSSSK